MIGYLFVFLPGFPPLWSCCVYDKWAAYDSAGGQSGEGGVNQTTESSRLQAQSSCQSLSGNMMLWSALGSPTVLISKHVYLTLNLQINGEGKCRRSTQGSARRSARTAPSRWVSGSDSLPAEREERHVAFSPEIVNRLSSRSATSVRVMTVPTRSRKAVKSTDR